ncbi:Uncharacterised protein [Mycobacteroides abscessus subsp. abscessus]|nr:Uncharacterised protein [Mycobacteroides abscessus subsp. abscessus]
MSLIGENLIRLVREKAASYPEFVYDNNGVACRYVVKGKPSCLIGHALWGADLIGPAFEHNQRNQVAFGHLVTPLGLSLDWREIAWLRRVQFLQDSGHAWGVAVSHADRTCALSATG